MRMWLGGFASDFRRAVCKVSEWSYDARPRTAVGVLAWNFETIITITVPLLLKISIITITTTVIIAITIAVISIGAAIYCMGTWP